MIAAAQAVKCVQGCGGDSTVSAIGIIVAFLSLGIAIAAFRISRDSLAIARREHKVFMEQVNARTDFELTVRLVDPGGAEDGDVVETYNDDELELRWELGVKVSGDKAAGDVGMNFLVPDSTARLSWVTQRGSGIKDDLGRFGPLIAPEELDAKDGSKHPAWYLIYERPRLSKPTALVRYASAAVPLHNVEVGTDVPIPVKFKVWSDDLPDDVTERSKTMEVIVRRKSLDDFTPRKFTA